MTIRQKNALADFLIKIEEVSELQGETKLQSLRHICQRFLDETRFIRSEAGPEYDV